MTTSAERLFTEVPGSAPRLFRLPGVYRPQEDTALLAAAIAEQGVPAGAHALDLCTGTGAQAITLLRHGAASAVAVDLSRRALVSAGVNAFSRGLPVRLRRGGVLTALAEGPFDLVVANPPYVPSPAPPTRATRGWDSGVDGRAVLDPLCRAASLLLRPGGRLLMVHSALSGVDVSLRLLAAAGLRARVVRRAWIPFGPVLAERAGWLEAAGLIEPGQRTEELVVLRADR